jgi:hypothetical protein
VPKKASNTKDSEGEGMKVGKLSTQVAILLLFAGVVSAAGQPMQSVVSAEGHFTVLMPATVQRAQKLHEFKDGKASTEYIFMSILDNGHVVYKLVYNDLPSVPSKVDVSKEQYFFEKIRDSVFSTISGKTLLTDSSIALDGVPGRAFTIGTGGGMTYAARVFLKGSRLYQLVVTSDRGYTADQTKQFMESFQIE